jgi:hypothetical protein
MVMDIAADIRAIVHRYNGPNLQVTIKQQFKVHWPGAGTAAFALPIYGLLRHPGEMTNAYYENNLI